jgi:hypothetical protein
MPVAGWLERMTLKMITQKEARRKDMDSIERVEAKFGPKRSESDSRSSSQRDGVPPTKQKKADICGKQIMSWKK